MIQKRFHGRMKKGDGRHVNQKGEKRYEILWHVQKGKNNKSHSHPFIGTGNRTHVTGPVRRSDCGARGNGNAMAVSLILGTPNR